MNQHQHRSCERCGAPTLPTPSASRTFCAPCASVASTGARSSSELLFTLTPAPEPERNTAEDLRALAGPKPMARASLAPFPPVPFAPPTPRSASRLVPTTLFAVAGLLLAGSAAALSLHVLRPAPEPVARVQSPSAPAMPTPPPVSAPTPVSEPTSPAPPAEEPPTLALTPPSNVAPRRARPARPSPARASRSAPAPVEDLGFDLDLEPSPVPSAPAPRTRLPERRDVSLALRALEDDVTTCAPGAEGATVITRVVFEGANGRVAHVEVVGSALPPAARSCIATALHSAALPTFAEDRFTVSYPFRI